MLAHTLTRALIAGFLALPGDAFITRPPTTAPVDTIGDCTSWVVAQPSDDCELLAKRNQVPLPQLLSYNPALQRNCEANAGFSYCKEKKNSSAGHELSPRAASGSAPDSVDTLINLLFVARIADELLKMLWTARTTTVYTSLSYANLADYLQRSAAGQVIMNGPNPADVIACDLPTLNSAVAKWVGAPGGTLTCICYDQTTCCEPTETICPVDPNAVANVSPSKLRLTRSSSLGRRFDIDNTIPALPKLERRVPNTYQWSAIAPNGQTYSGSYTAIAWPGPSDFATTDWIWQHAFAMDFADDCTALYLKEYTWAQVVAHLNNLNINQPYWQYMQVEHYFEKNLLAKFSADCINGVLPSGAAFPAGLAIPPTFFTTFMNTANAALANVPTVPGAQAVTTPVVRVMHTLGTNAYRDNFLLLQARLNNMKAGFMRGDDPVVEGTMANAMAGAPRLFITNLRMAFNLINYMNNADALEKGEMTARALRWEWYNYQLIFNQQNGINVNVLAAFDIWYKDFMQSRFPIMSTWLTAWITDGATNYEGNIDQLSQNVEGVLAYYMSQVRQLGGYNDQGYPTGTPTSYSTP